MTNMHLKKNKFKFVIIKLTSGVGCMIHPDNTVVGRTQTGS